MTRYMLASLLLAAALGVGLSSCGSSGVGPDARRGHESDSLAVSYDAHGEPKGLHNYRRWSDRIGQGAQPAGEKAFRNLAALGFSTVVSVDGARPDLENAARFGLRYVHVPIGYHGIDTDAALQIVKAVNSSDGAVYVHCHHGRHRGPAATMVARIAAEKLTNVQAVNDLKESGCSPKYKGLYRDVAEFSAPSDAALATSGDLSEYVVPDGLVEVMVDVDYRYGNLKESRVEEWSVPRSSPDIDPPHEARMLWEAYREMARLGEARELGDGFLQQLKAAEQTVVDLENALREGGATAAESVWPRVKDGCDNCHSVYRNRR